MSRFAQGPVSLDRAAGLVLVSNTPKGNAEGRLEEVIHLLLGRGVFATRRIPAKTVVEICPVLVFPAQDFRTIEDTLLNHYT